MSDQPSSKNPHWNTTHGATIGPRKNWKKLYGVWQTMKSRCENPNSKAFPYYGGRGIRVIWPSYEAFSADMEATYRPGLSIERTDNDGNYCKENCRWATAKEQARNQRTSRWLEFNGEKRTMIDWAEQYGVGVRTLWWRLSVGWSLEKALTTPVRPMNIHKA